MRRGSRAHAIAGRRWAVLAALVVASCRSPASTDLPGLAERPPLPCSVFVTGGAFIEARAPGVGDQPRARTFALDEAEAFTLGALGQALVRGRVFVRTEADDRAADVRRQLARSFGMPELEDVLGAARARGHDYLLVIERVDDGPIEFLGVNGQWPITLATWLLVGLGAVIPDHGYESRASLRASLRDAHDGRTVQEIVVGTIPVELSLLERTGVWGWVQSILVPPFWVGDDDERVVNKVRPVVRQRLAMAVAQRLKSVDVSDRLTRNQPALVTLRRGATGLEFEVVAQEALSFVRLRVDGSVVDGPRFEAFHGALLASRSTTEDAHRYTAVLEVAPQRGRLQVLMQAITGRVGSVSVDLQEVR